MSPLQSDLQEVFRRVFDEDDLVIHDGTSAADINGWDSMAHINLIIAIEKRFGVKFSAAEIGALGRPGQSVGDMLRLLEMKTQRATP
jgi:acyl carrier protein